MNTPQSPKSKFSNTKDSEREQVPKRGIAGWLMFDWAAQPVFTLITTFIFAPYFASGFIGDPVQGQALWGYGTAIAGVIVAIFSPIFGAVADVTGRRKPWIAGFSVLLILGCVMLLFAVPHVPPSPEQVGSNAIFRPFDLLVLVVLAGYVLATVGAEFATVFTNAMMPDLVSPRRLGRLSGIGWAVGYAGGLVSLIFVLAFMIASPDTGRTLVGFEPIWNLSPSASEGERATGPLTALWYLIFVIPLFLFTPDRERTAQITLMNAATQGFGDLVNRFKEARKDRRFFLYLIAHMLYVDGLAALFVFGGIYASGIFSWTTTDLGIFGIFLTITGTFGAIVGGELNDRLGSLKVIAGSIIILILACITILSIDQNTILFLVPVSEGFAELCYFAIGGIIGAVAGPLQSASRTYLAEITEPDQRTSAYGLYAMVGKVTSFAGPLAVGALTAISGSQRVGISALVVFLIAGLWVLGMAARAKTRQA